MIDKIVVVFAKKLRAGLKSKGTTFIGVSKILGGLASILTGIFAAEGVNPELIIGGGIYLIVDGVQAIFTRDADTSSQDSGVRPEGNVKKEDVIPPLDRI